METFIDRYARDIQFAAAIAEQNRETEQYINECLIKASGNKRAIQEMTILNESSFGDKIKGFFEKIKNFFKKIFDKFAASMSAVFSEQKEYINKYATIVTKCKYQATDVEGVKDHFKGLPRIIDAVDNTDTAIIGSNLDKYFASDKVPSTEGEITLSQAFPYDNGENLINASKNPPEKINLETIRGKALDEFVQTGYWSGMADFSKETDDNGNVNFDDTFRVYFDGSKDDVSWDKDQIDSNFQTIINTTYAGQSYLKKLEKINERINAKMLEASKKMEDYYEAQKKKIIDSIEKMGASSADATKDNNISQVKPEEIKKTDNGKFIYHGVTYDTEEKARDAKTEREKNDRTVKPTTEKPEENVNSGYEYSSSFDYFTESTPRESGNSSSTDTNSKDKPSGQTGVQQNQNASTGAETVSKLKANSPKVKENTIDKVTDNNKEEVKKAALNLLDNYDIYNRQARVNADTQISSAIARAIYGSFQQLNKDFYWIIQKHVQWYLGNPGAQDKTENQRSKVSNLNMNAGGETVNKSTPVTTNQNNGGSNAEQNNSNVTDEQIVNYFENKGWTDNAVYKQWIANKNDQTLRAKVVNATKVNQAPI